MLYLLITTLIWAFSFGLIGNVLQRVDPVMVAALRLSTALLVFLPLLRPKQISFAERCHLAAIGAVQFGTMYVCYLSAFRFIPSHLVALFSVLTPIYVVLLHDMIRRQFHWRYLLAAVLSVAGASAINLKGGETGSLWIGFILMQVSGLSFAFGQVAYREWKLERRTVNDREIFAFLYAGGAAVALVASFLMIPEPANFLDLSGVEFGLILYLGAVASGLGFFLWNKGATLCSAGALAAFNNALIPLAMFVSLFVFGEIDGASASDLGRLAVGAALIAVAVFIGKNKSA
ncbi:MAG TPA: EamA family transporter [Opitutales bacterium]|nr:EamA family transporter [Opitutales bacterium]